MTVVFRRKVLNFNVKYAERHNFMSPAVVSRMIRQFTLERILPAKKFKPIELQLAAKLSGVIALRMLGLFLILPVFMVLAR